MKEEIKEIGKLHEILDDVVDSFKPNDETTPHRYVELQRHLRDVESVDLSELSSGSLLYVCGRHTGASHWLLRVSDKDGQKIVDMWRDLDTNGVSASIDKIIAVDIQGKGEDAQWIVDRGVIRRGANIAYPYFSYEESPEGEKKVCIPDTYWMDNCRSLSRVDF